MPDTLLSPEILVPRLGDTLVQEGYITREQLQEALKAQQSLAKKGTAAPMIGQILVQNDIITKSDLDYVITQHVIRLREVLEESNKNLEKCVKLRTAQLEKALSQLEKVNEERTNFISNISHELRTPMTHIRGYMDLLKDPDFGELNQSQEQAINTISKAAKNLETLIETLITFSDIQKTDSDIRFVKSDINKLAQTIAADFAPRAKEKGVTFSYNVPDTVSLVSIDEQKISWTIEQLLENALKFTPMGGGIYLYLVKKQPKVTISVTDTGIGIPKERQQEIFVPFHQLDGSASRKFGGVGLGLSLAQQILELHSATLELYSEVDKGSSFSFDLPLIQTH